MSSPSLIYFCNRLINFIEKLGMYFTHPLFCFGRIEGGYAHALSPIDLFLL